MIARLSRVDREDPTDLTDDSRLLHGNLSATNTKLRQDDNVVGEIEPIVAIISRHSDS